MQKVYSAQSTMRPWRFKVTDMNLRVMKIWFEITANTRTKTKMIIMIIVIIRVIMLIAIIEQEQ